MEGESSAFARPLTDARHRGHRAPGRAREPLMTTPVELSRDDAHPRAREALTDAFFWDASDPCAPFGDETGQEVLEAFRDFRVEEPRGEPLSLLGELLARWEVADASWDA